MLAEQDKEAKVIFELYEDEYGFDLEKFSKDISVLNREKKK